MWNFLHPYAKTERSYQLAGKLLPWVAVIAALSFIVGITWGLAFVPADYLQGESFRIMYVHVPAASMSMLVYASMAITAFIGLVWQQKQAGMMVAAIAPVGAGFTFIALATGSIWGKPMWGAWWVWDARLTSELILLFLYLGVISLYHSFSDKIQAGKAAGMLAMVGIINLPIIHFSVEWWNTQHQKASISKFAKPAIYSEMLWPLLISLFAFGCISILLILMRFRNEVLKCELHRPWVMALLSEGRRHGI